MAGEELTPMMRQYRRIKAELPDGVILMFRLGDFYEMFAEDARRAAPVLGVALTQRAGTTMCGVPYHALDVYITKLIRAGMKAAICEQVEDPAAAKGIVRREVTRVVTPGTITEDGLLDASCNNYIACVCSAKNAIGFALMDLSTGEFSVEPLETVERVTEALSRWNPSELLIAKPMDDEPPTPAFIVPEGMTTTTVDAWTMEYDSAYDCLLRHFRVHSLEGYGCEGSVALVGAAGALLNYVHETLRHHTAHVRTLHVRHADDFLTLDESTTQHLDLVPVRGKPMESTLLGVLNNTRTPMGARLLRTWIVRPLRVRTAIVERQDVVEMFTTQRMTLADLREKLVGVRDMERLIARIDAGRGNARDVRALAASLLPIPAIIDRLNAPELAQAALLPALATHLHALPDIVALVDAALVETPPVGIKDGGLIQQGYDATLDELRALASEGHAWLANYQATEQVRTGIKTLKVRHNKIFGFYIEISKGQAGAVPPEYERRQTLVNAERFITPELKAYEQKIFGAQDRAMAMEFELFNAVRDRVIAYTAQIQETADAVAQLDVLLSLADRALALGYTRPEMTDDDELVIHDGRHPVIEQLPDAESFVPNDTQLDCRTNQIMLITGPNMAGKSTYIRQVAVIAVMAHIGSFVPARAARIATLDRVFTRVGAGDDLTRGRSTFMVEMQEAANILNNATPKSLIVLDEIGRGTSTFDGISIAWAVAEYLHNNPKVKAKTLFATHYHELTDLATTLPGVQNYTVQVREQGNHVVFLRRITRGVADKSYGIHVAQMAGMPDEVVGRATQILKNLEENELDVNEPKLVKKPRKKISDVPGQMTFF